MTANTVDVEDMDIAGGGHDGSADDDAVAIVNC